MSMTSKPADRAYLNPARDDERTRIPPGTFWNIDEAKKNQIYFYLKEIKALKPNGRVIVDGLGEMIMLGGYSYLGLKDHPKIQQAAKHAIDEFGAGTDGSRFLAGTLTLHNQLEKTIARFKKTEDSITFTSGYLANVSTISTILRRNDLVFCDKMNHASIIDGCVFSRAHLVRYPYGDVDMLEKYLSKITAKVRKLVVVDAVYSMEGTIADLPRIKSLCQKYGAYLMVDEAHSVGVLGEKGTGIEEYFGLPSDTIDIKMGTLSKAIPSTGGYVAGNRLLIQFLKHEARGFLYSGAPASASIAAALVAFQVIEDEPFRVKELHRKTGTFKKKLIDAGFNVGETQTPIIPIILGDFTITSKMAKYCQDRGIFIHAIHPPVVHEGSSRLRASITFSNSDEDLDYCAETLKKGASQLGIHLGQ
jgi:8-amino-7-oxononanoate synthase